MHLRRALLLFAIVLGLAALATSVSRPSREPGRGARTAPPSTAPEATPAPALPHDHEGALRLPRAGGGRMVALERGRAATLLVTVDEAGQVELPRLGLVAPAEPLTPARFELLVANPGRYEVRFDPAAGGESRVLGRLVVR